MKCVKVLWTGGFDSTYRVSQLSRCDVEIQPYYVFNDFRDSGNLEIETVNELIKMFEAMDQTKAKFLPLITFNSQDFLEENFDEEEAVREARKKVVENHFIGLQYIYLCGFSRKFPGAELSVHDNVIDILQTYGELIKIHDDDIGDYWIVDESKTPDYLSLIFKDFHFPLVGYTKKSMTEDYNEHGLTEIMNRTWFCHTPINGKPCGECNPCKYTIEEGLYWRFDKRALLRYVLRKFKIKLIARRSKRFAALTLKEIRKYPRYLNWDRKKYYRYLRRDYRHYKGYMKKDYRKYRSNLRGNIRGYPGFMKSDVRKYGRYVKRDLRQYKGYMKKDYKKYRKYFGWTKRAYVLYFMRFRDEWNN